MISMQVELVNSYHLAMTALAGLDHVSTRYERMVWAVDAYVREHGGKPVRVYEVMCEALEHSLV